MDLVGLLLTLALGLALAYGASVAYSAWVLTHPPRRNYAWAVARNLPGDPGEARTAGGGALSFTSWSFRATAGELPVWDITGLDPAGPIIVFTHGWGDSRVVALPRLAALAPLASRIVAWDLPGHGESPGGDRLAPGSICRLGSREAFDLARLVEHLRPDPERLVLAGSSLGAGVSIEAVGRGLVHPRAVIAEAPYRVPIVPARNVMRSAGLPWRLNLPAALILLGVRFVGDPRWPWGGGRDPFDRALWAAKFSEFGVPLLVLHGDADNVCPLEDARAIADAAGGRARLVVIENGEHNNLWTQESSRLRCVAAVSAWMVGEGLEVAKWQSGKVAE
jgi:pimeloyl-ACP methyl ester carboxylesterase